MGRSLGIVVPVFRPDVARLSAYVEEVRDRIDPAVIRIEADAPDETTRDALEDLPVEVGIARTRRGKGAAITDGFEALETAVFAFADADGSTPADSLDSVVTPVLDDETDLSVGSRRHPEATVLSHQTVLRRFLGDGFAWLARRLLAAKLYDYQCGAKAISRAAWEEIRRDLHEPGFAWDIELIAVSAAAGLRIREVPVTWEDQPGSTVSPVSDTIAMFRGLLSARHRAKLVERDRLHELVESRRENSPALVSRPEDE